MPPSSGLSTELGAIHESSLRVRGSHRTEALRPLPTQSLTMFIRPPPSSVGCAASLTARSKKLRSSKSVSSTVGARSAATCHCSGSS